MEGGTPSLPRWCVVHTHLADVGDGRESGCRTESLCSTKSWGLDKAVIFRNLFVMVPLSKVVRGCVKEKGLTGFRKAFLYAVKPKRSAMAEFGF